MKRLFLLFLVFTFIIQTVWADPLLLTDAEMKKLERYFPNEDSTHFTWEGDPISVQLPLNKEKRLIFSSAITPDLKGALMTDQLRILNDNKSLYLTALKSFATTRLFVTLQDTGEVVLIDISTDDKATNATTYIDRKQNHHLAVTSSTVMNSTDSVSLNSNASDNDSYITLIRFAWQQLFAPERLLKNPWGIFRAPMHTESILETLIYGDKVYAHPESSWVYNNMYVTAVILRNKYPHPATIHLDRDLCGDWQAAALYPQSQLKPSEEKTGDTLVLFLVSKKPFGDSMRVCDGHA